VKESLGTLPGLVMSGGVGRDGSVSEVWRLDLATLQWGPMPALVAARFNHACCVVRGALVLLGGYVENQEEEEETTSRVEILSEGGENGVFTDLPALSCGGITDAVAIAVEVSRSLAGQVLLLGGENEDGERLSTVLLVDLVTGVCTPQEPSLLDSRAGCAAVRIPDGRVACAGAGGGGFDSNALAEVWGPPASVAPLVLSGRRYGSRGCVMSDGRFAVLGGERNSGYTSSCEALMVDKEEHWEARASSHAPRTERLCVRSGGQMHHSGGWRGWYPISRSVR